MGHFRSRGTLRGLIYVKAQKWHKIRLDLSIAGQIIVVQTIAVLLTERC